MPSYKYSAINDRGNTIRGTVVAENAMDLEGRLKDLGLDLISARASKSRRKNSGKNAKLKQKD